jgi:hypothetical protein
MPMRRVFVGIALAVAIVVVWQWQRSAPRSKAAALHRDAVSQPVSQVKREPVKARAAQPVKVNAPTPPVAATQEVVADPRLPKEVNAKFAKQASSYIPPQQRADPGIMGRIIGTRLRWFNEDLAEQEPSAEWTKAMQEQLEKALALVPNSHLLSVDCRETTCKVEIIHEDDLRAVDFNGELPTSPVGDALPHDLVSFVERSEDDGQLRNTVFVERDGPGLRQKLADLLGLDEEDVP